MSKADEIFKNHFASVGHEIRPEQARVIESVLKGKNTLCLMPTGAGKSLCYWVAGKALDGITIVIFPLTALMDEQEKKLTDHGFDVLNLHSGKNAGLQKDRLINVYNDREQPDFIFVSPERLSTDGFVEFVLKHVRDRIKMLVVDEIHCISQWGLDFRPFYKEIPPFIDNIFGDTPRPVILGLTATLNPKDQEEICKDFNITRKDLLKSQFLLRNNIQLDVVKVRDEEEKDELLWDDLEQHKSDKLLVYVDRREGKRSTKQLCEIAQSKGHKAEYFHGGRSSDVKAEIIERYKKGDLNVVFATSAFGMGIDIPDIRGVIHYLLPDSIEQYYQQIGRVGRDNKESWAKLYYSDKNITVRRRDYIGKSFPRDDEIMKGFEILTDYKIGKRTFNYFEEHSAQASFHYLLRTSVIEVVCKGIRKLSVFKAKESLSEFEQYINATKKGLLITTARKLDKSESEISANIYSWMAQEKLADENTPSKCLVIEAHADSLSEELQEEIRSDIEEKKGFKQGNFDDFVELLNGFADSAHFQRAIGEYLGIDKFELNRIHQTLSGIMVRSKSEVIVANILHERNIDFEYETLLEAPDGTCYCPDFTIRSNGKTYYWEHLGMLDNQGYREQWEIKNKWYNKYYPGQLITTTESSTLSKTAENIVEESL